MEELCSYDKLGFGSCQIQTLLVVCRSVGSSGRVGDITALSNEVVYLFQICHE